MGLLMVDHHEVRLASFSTCLALTQVLLLCINVIVSAALAMAVMPFTSSETIRKGSFTSVFHDLPGKFKMCTKTFLVVAILGWGHIFCEYYVARKSVLSLSLVAVIMLAWAKYVMVWSDERCSCSFIIIHQNFDPTK